MLLLKVAALGLVISGALVIGLQTFPVREPQQPLQAARVTNVVFIVPKPAKLLKPKLLSEHDLTHILQRAGWPRKLHKQAIKVAFCESSLNPQAVGKQNSYDIGVLQINAWIHRKIISGRTIAEKKTSLMNPYTNARIALKVYEEGKRIWGSGWRPWRASRGCHGLV